MSDEADDRSQTWLAGLTSLVLLGGLGVLVLAFLGDRRRAPVPAPRAPRPVPARAPASTTLAAASVPPPSRTGAPPAPSGSGALPAKPGQGPAADLIADTPWDALAVVLLKYGIGARTEGGIPAPAAALMGEGYARLDRIARKLDLSDAQAAFYVPEVRDRLSVSLLGAAGVVLTTDQEALVRKFNREEYGEAWRKEAFREAAPPLARALKILESQERYERFLKTLIRPEQQEAYLAALGSDPLRNERIPVETVKTAPQDRAQAVAERWDQVFNHAVPADVLRGRAADLVWRMDDVRASYETREGRPLGAESERSVRRRILKLQVEAEAMVCPAPSAGSPRALRFEAP